MTATLLVCTRLLDERTKGGDLAAINDGKARLF